MFLVVCLELSFLCNLPQDTNEKFDRHNEHNLCFFKLHKTGHGKTNFNFTLYRNLSQILWSKRSNENRKNTCKLTWISALVKCWSWQLDAPWGNWNTKNIRNKDFVIGYLLQSIRSRTQVESSSLYFYTKMVFLTGYHIPSSRLHLNLIRLRVWKSLKIVMI